MTTLPSESAQTPCCAEPLFARHTKLPARGIISSFSGSYAFLSNFAPSPIRGVRSRLVYPTAEHAYQAMKSADPLAWAEAAALATPGKAKRWGQRIPLRPRWDAMKVLIMTRVVRAKFRQNLALQTLLLATGDQELVEGNTWGDRFWGTCDGVGLNHLGRILMATRDRARLGKL